MTDSKYFAFIDGEQRGPYDLDRLADAGVRPSTYVWCKGMDDWKRADEVEEIREAFRRHIIHKREGVEMPREPHMETVIPEEVSRGSEHSETSSQEGPRWFRGIPPQPEPEIDPNMPPQVSMTLAVLSLILCFPLTGIVAVVFTYKAQNCWKQSMIDAANATELRKKCHEYERMAKMWMGLTIAFGIIAWTLVFSVR